MPDTRYIVVADLVRPMHSIWFVGTINKPMRPDRIEWSDVKNMLDSKDGSTRVSFFRDQERCVKGRAVEIMRRVEEHPAVATDEDPIIIRVRFEGAKWAPHHGKLPEIVHLSN